MTNDQAVTATPAPGYADHNSDYRKRLRRIEGQVRGLQRMVDEDVYCIDILTRVSAVNRALQSVAVGLVEDQLTHFVSDAVGSAADRVTGGCRAGGGQGGRGECRDRAAVEELTWVRRIRWRNDLPWSRPLSAPATRRRLPRSTRRTTPS